MLNADVLFPLDLDVGRFSILFGPKVYAALLEEENNDVMSVAAGVEGRLELDRRRRLAIVGHAYFAPDIFTFGSADQLTGLGARAELRLGPRLVGFAGMRWFEFDLTEGGGQRTLQEELFGGVVNSSVAVIMVVCLAAGLLVGLVSLAPTIYRGRTDARRLRQQLAELDAIDAGLARDSKQAIGGAVPVRKRGKAMPKLKADDAAL